MERMKKQILSVFLVMALVLSLLPGAALAAGGSARSGEVIDVTDYGADPTGTKESSTAVIAALAAAKELPEGTQKTIRFPKGEYHFYADYSEVRELYVSNTVGTNQTYKNKHLGILVEDLDNVTIDGGGSQFIYHGDITSFATIRSNNVKFQNFSVDHASPSVVDVTVESIEGQTATLYIPPCYTYTISGTTITWKGEVGPVTGTPYWTGNNNLGYQQGMNTIDGHTQRGTGGPFSGVSAIETVPGDPTHIKVTYSGSLPVLGMCYQLRNTTRTTPGTFFWESDGVTLQDINIQFLHGFGMVGQLSKNITLDTVKFEARPGTGRTTAGFADFVQMSSVGGKVTIRNCEFSNPHDDPINIHGTFLEVTEVSNGNKTFKVQYKHGETAGFPQYYVGDKVDFSVKSSMAPVANSERTVMAVTNPGEGGNDLTTITITLDEPVNGITAGNYVVENVTYTPEVLIENCRFVETPTRGILVTTRREVIIQNNYFDRMGMAAIYISCDASNWRESGRTENVTIRNNTFVVDPYTQAQAAIYVDPSGNGSAGNRIHKNMLIENNVFNMAGQSVNAIYAKSVNGLTIRNNIIQRYKPDVSLTLSGTQSVTVGGTQATTLTSSGSTYAPSTRMLRFDDCESVTLENNIYDDGLFVGIGGNSSSQLSGTDMALNGDQSLPAVGQARYFSSDPTVATVDESGVVTGVSAGTAEIYAYRVAGARTFESNHLTFTVTGTAAAKPNKIEITADKDKVDVNGTVNLTATVDPSDAGSVAWSVKPASDGGLATITSGGVLTATAPGVVEVTASLGGVTASKLVTVNAPTGGLNRGEEGGKAKQGQWHIRSEEAGKWLLNEADNSVTITAQSGNDWANQTAGKNFFLTKAPDGDFEATVKMSGTTCGGSNCWCEAGIVLFQDGNNYTFTGRKNANGSPNFSLTWELNTSTDRDETTISKVDGDIYLKLAKSGNTYTGYYSTNGSQWTQIGSHGSLTFTNYEIGFFADNAGTPHDSQDYNFTFSDFKINNVGVSLVDNGTAPTASGVSVTNANPLTVSYSYADTDNDAQTNSIIAWYASDSETGHYTRVEGANTNTLTVTAATGGKWVKAVVVPRDATGRYGAPVTSAAVQAPAQPVVQDDATLATLSVSGLPLTPAFDPAVTKYTVSVPASATKVTVSATATQGAAATVAGTGPVTISGAKTTATVTVTAPDGDTQKTYTVTIDRAASSDATLSGLTASAGSAAITYNAATRFYELVAAQTAQNLTFSATKADPNATIAVRYNAEEKGAYETAPHTLPLTAGLNNLELRVTAEDGISTALYRVRVMKPASAEAELTSLTVNGEAVTIPADSTDLGLIQASGDTATLNATVSDGASVYISVDGKAVENGGSATLTKTLSVATVRVVAEDGATENVYTLALSKNDPGNADLYLLKLDGMTLSPAFDKDTLTYTATFTDAQGTSALTATAIQVGADVTCETVSVYKTAKGRMECDCHFFRDVEENFVKVTVTSPNGETTKKYIVNVTYEPVVYLSDLQWTSHTSGWSGWANPGVDIGVENKPLVLRGANGLETFEKGLGTHASSNTTFDISGRGFTRFTAKVGPNQGSGGSPHISFEVQGDGQRLWSSSNGSTDSAYEITHSDPYQTIDIDVTGVSTLKIIDAQSGGNSNAHATWADAKFYGDSIGPALKETDVSVKYIKFEHEEHTIYVNGTDDAHPSSVELHPTFKPVGVTKSAHTLALDWDSSDDSVATVTDGRVTPFGVGETTVTATAVDKNATDTCAITVKKLVKGTLSVSGDLRYGTQLTVQDNALDQDVKSNVTYTWYRGEGTSGTVLGTGKTYTPAKDDIDSKLTVKAAAKDTATYYEGETAFTTAKIGREAGHEVNEDNITYKNCSGETAEDGEIGGLLAGHVYQYQKQSADETWPEAWEDVAEGNLTITGLTPGNYRIRHAGDETSEPGEPSNTITISVVGTTEVALTVPQRFVGGVVRANRSQIPVGDTVTLTVTPDKGYELDTLKAKYTDENDAEQTLTPALQNGKYTFVMPAFPVTIDATFTKSTYTIGHGLEHISCNEEEHQHTATHGESFSIILTPDEGYNMPNTLTVTETDTGKEFTDFTYDASETDPAKRVLTFPNGVTCHITVEGAGVPKTYTVVYELTNGLTAPGAPQTVTHDSKLEATLTAAKGYTLPETVTVAVGGAALGAGDFTYEAGKITVEKVTGNVVITAQGKAEDVPLRAVTLVGPARVGRTLTVNVEPTLATVDCQWFLVDEDGTETEIAGATGKRYVIPANAEGKTVKVRVTGKDGYAGELTSDPTGTILAADQPFVYVTGIELSAQEAEVAVGNKVTLTATVTPDNATAPALAWSSDNEAIATVKDGVVTGVAEGTVTITASSTDTIDAVTATCAVTVTKAETPVTPSKPSTSTTRPSTPTTEVKEDGTKVTTETKPDGTKVETVETPDGTKSETETKKDGTVTEKVETPDGTKSVTETKPDGTVTAKVEEPDGTKSVTETKPDGSKTATVEQADGTKSETVVTAEGEATVTVTDAEGEELAKVEIPATIPEPETKFEDLAPTPWAEEAINKVAGLELVKGVGGNKYDPVTPMTRGALATVLHRLSNGKTDYEVAFKDVQSNKYYTEGVAWAAKANVVKGISADIFAPDDIITREQLAVMLARYAKLIGMNTKADAKALDQFADGDSTGAWAVDGVAWCVEKGILKGKGVDGLDPTAEVSRAEVAVMLDRFIALIK